MSERVLRAGRGGHDLALWFLAPSVRLTDAERLGAEFTLGTTGGPSRVREHHWIPLLAVVVEAPESAVASKYLFYESPKADNAWCPSCIVDALVQFATLALVSPEAVRAGRNLLGRRRSRA